MIGGSGGQGGFGGEGGSGGGLGELGGADGGGRGSGGGGEGAEFGGHKGNGGGRGGSVSAQRSHAPQNICPVSEPQMVCTQDIVRVPPLKLVKNGSPHAMPAATDASQAL